MATQNSIDSPRRGGITTPKTIIAQPTRKIVRVCPKPHSNPMVAELLMDPWRTTIVEHSNDVIRVGGMAHPQKQSQ